MGADSSGAPSLRLASASPAVASFGAQLRGFRVRAGFTQQALAERAGLGVATLKALEHNKRQRPRPSTVALLAEALGLGSADRATLFELTSAPAPTRDSAAVDMRPNPHTDERVRLPTPPTALIGRDAEVAEVRALLDPTLGSARLVTLVGTGGVGKTRLALAAAAGLGDAYPDGVVFVDLAPLSDARLVPATIARALGVREGGGPSTLELLQQHLRSRCTLLVLDNFEHLLAAAPMLAELMRECPRVGVLVTSRAALRLQVERRLVVGPLATPADMHDADPAGIAASPAVQLFVERAQAAADFSLTRENAEPVAAICRRLDGLPLAIELAAARVRLLQPATLLGRLERRLAVLTGGPADLPERQQALRTALAWSVELLEPAERALFRRLAVFAGGWNVDAAEALAADDDADVLDGLHLLVDSSLVLRGHDQTGDEPRFSMLETVREYALEQLTVHGEANDWRGRHAAFFLDLAEQAEPHLRDVDQRSWFDRLDRELDNVRVALAWARSSGNLELGLQLAVALAVFCEERGHVREGCDWLAALMPEETAAPLAALQARAEATRAWLMFLLGDYQRARPLAERSLAR